MAATGNHSGYEFSWSMFHILPSTSAASEHHFHHSKNDGNYGSFILIWDILFGTIRTKKKDDQTVTFKCKNKIR
jgi:sterol desaturase/sphingolipid hydroxylase (fatty acid hydroxylase superfamily)